MTDYHRLDVLNKYLFFMVLKTGNSSIKEQADMTCSLQIAIFLYPFKAEGGETISPISS
jgi:hypothetical protein